MSRLRSFISNLKRKHAAMMLDAVACPMILMKGQAGCIPELDDIAKRMEDYFGHLSIERRQEIFLYWLIGEEK